MATIRSSLKHTLREGNKVAYKLANMGADQDEKMVSRVIPMDEVISLLETDMRRVVWGLLLQYTSLKLLGRGR